VATGYIRREGKAEVVISAREEDTQMGGDGFIPPSCRWATGTLMSLWKDILYGRTDGFRSTVRKPLAKLLGLSPEAAPEPQPFEPIQAGEKALNLGIEPPKDVTPPDGYEVVLHKDALKPGQIIEVIIGGRAIAVANVDGEFHACSNTCPHAEGPLGEGQLDGTTLTCPYHGWQFDVITGACLTSPDDPVPIHAVEVVDDAVCVAI